MIPKNKYIKIWPTEEMMGVTFDMVKKAHTKEEYLNFIKFMGGQTCGRMDNGETGIYSYDYERWIKSGKLTEQGIDWD